MLGPFLDQFQSQDLDHLNRNWSKDNTLQTRSIRVSRQTSHGRIDPTQIQTWKPQPRQWNTPISLKTRLETAVQRWSKSLPVRRYTSQLRSNMMIRIKTKKFINLKVSRVNTSQKDIIWLKMRRWVPSLIDLSISVEEAPSMTNWTDTSRISPKRS